MDGDWKIRSYIEDQQEFIDESLTMEIVFSEIDKGEGEVVFKVTEDGDLYTYPGKFELNDDYSEIEVLTATNNPAQTQLWEGEFIVTDQWLSIIGTERLVGEAATEKFSIIADRK